MDGTWKFKFAATVAAALLAMAWLVWTLGAWSTAEEIEAWKNRGDQLSAQVEAALGADEKAAAEQTLADHMAKAPGSDHPDAHTVAPSWAEVFPQQKLNLGLDLQGGIDLELQVELRKALEASADRGVSDLCNVIEEEGITCSGKRLENSSEMALFVQPSDHDKARATVVDKTFIYVFAGRRTIDEKDALLFNLTEDYAANVKDTALQQAVETIRNRVDEFGVTEPLILTKGVDRITVQLPGLDDPQRAIDLVGKTAQLEFRMLYNENEWPQTRVEGVVSAAVEAAGLGTNYTDIALRRALDGKLPEDAEIFHKKKFDEISQRLLREEPYLVNKRVDLTGDRVEYASVSRDQFNQPYVRMELDDEGGRIFAKLSGDNVGKRMAIVLDNNVNSAPVFNEKIPNGVASITLGDGNDPRVLQDADDLKIVLQAGALPAPIEILHNRTVGKTLGDDSISAGRMAALIALVIILAFMVLYYRGAGIIANVAVILNMVLLLALLAAFGATLTLPGIAGIILTIGMAVDANVIIYERIREEVLAGKSVRASVAAGYEKATWTILDANITTFITGAVLFSYGSGPIKGFAVTLMVGIITSVFTALVVTRLIFDWQTHSRGVQRLSIGI
ncbi:MAG: protein translocase subunit SecD [Proteobacteria bacterium]|nr:protein translocase subunit SecD [Pseudomonadota bacterium]